MSGLSSAFKKSAVLHGCRHFADSVYGAFSHGLFGRIFTSYFSVNDNFEQSSFYKKASAPFASPPLRRVRHAAAKLTETSAFAGILRSIVPHLLCCRLRVYGVFLLIFCVYSALISCAGFFFEAFKFVLLDFAVSCAVILLSFPLLLSQKSLASTLSGSRFFHGFVVTALGIRGEDFDAAADAPATGRSNTGLIFGIIAGCMSFFVPPYVTLGAIFAAAAAALVFCMPESGIVFIFAALPLLPTRYLAMMILFTAAAFLFKVLRGKRIFRFELLDVAVLLYAAVIAGGGFISFSDSSAETAKLTLILMLVYFLTANLIRTREDLTRCVWALIIGAAAASLYGIYQYLYDPVDGTWLDTAMFSNISSRVTSTFDNPNMFAEFLEMTLPFLIASSFIAKRGAESANRPLTGSVMRFTVFAMCFGCLVITWSRGAWLGFAFGLIIFMLTVSRKSLFILLGAAAAVPFAAIFLPETVYSRLTSIGSMSDSSTVFRVNVWRSSMDMLNKYGLFGVGVGDGAFSAVFPVFAYSGVQTAVHSHCLYMQIALENGVVGLFFFLALIFVFLQCAFTSLKSYRDKTVGCIISAALAGASAILLHGVVDHVFYNMRVFLLFILLLGLTGAASRIVSRERSGRTRISDDRADINLANL